MKYDDERKFHTDYITKATSLSSCIIGNENNIFKCIFHPERIIIVDIIQSHIWVVYIK